jgi:ABC-2 type transport system permease protein
MIAAELAGFAPPFLGAGFYSTRILPPVWQMVSLFNPVVNLICAFRWSFYGFAHRDRR